MFNLGKITNLACITALGAATMLVPVAHAETGCISANESFPSCTKKRLDTLEATGLELPLEISATAQVAGLSSPISGTVTGLSFVMPKAAAAGGSAITLTASINGVTTGTTSLTVPSGTALLGQVSGTITTSNSLKVGDVLSVSSSAGLNFTGTPGLTNTKALVTVTVSRSQ